MQNRIVLVSDDSDFFEYLIPKLFIRKNDEIFRWSYEKFYEKMSLYKNSVIIINAENKNEEALSFLYLLKDRPVIFFAYNVNKDFELKAYQAGVLHFITPFTDDDELQAKLSLALKLASVLEKSQQYREFLVNNSIIKQDKEVFLDYENIMDKELEKIRNNASNAVLVAISPNEKTKFLIQSDKMEEIILDNIRKNDILMNYAPNKYFLILFDTNIESAEKKWAKIRGKMPEKIYAGFANILTKERRQLINEVLSKLHEAINYDKDYIERTPVADIGISGGNFKVFRQELNKKIENIIVPVFYHIQQKYNAKLFGMMIEQYCKDGVSILTIKGRNASASFTITWPGFSKINMDIEYKTANAIPSQIFSIDHSDLEAGFIEDLLEQFIMEFRKEINDDNS